MNIERRETEEGSRKVQFLIVKQKRGLQIATKKCWPTVTNMEKKNSNEKEMAGTNGARFVRATCGDISKWQIFVEYLQMIIKINIIIISSIFRFFFPRRDTIWKEEIVLITGSAGYVGKNLAVKIAMKGSNY